VLGRDADIRGNKVFTRLNQIYSEQEKFIILEVEVPQQRAETRLKLVDVGVTYTDLFSQKRESIERYATVSFSGFRQDVDEALDAETYESAAEQVANELNREAVELRDKGDIEGAKSILRRSADYLENLGESLASPKLLEQKAEALQDADDLSNQEEWNKKRKELKERQYKRATQQSY
jgi:Ca-activated chloride channel family protein